MPRHSNWLIHSSSFRWHYAAGQRSSMRSRDWFWTPETVRHPARFVITFHIFIEHRVICRLWIVASISQCVIIILLACNMAGISWRNSILLEYNTDKLQCCLSRLNSTYIKIMRELFVLLMLSVDTWCSCSVVCLLWFLVPGILSAPFVHGGYF